MLSSLSSTAFCKALTWIILTGISVTVSGQGDSDFLARIRANSRNADLSDRLERAFARKHVQPPPERPRPDPSGPDVEGGGPDIGGPDFGPDSKVPAGLGGPPGSPGPDVIDGQGGGPNGPDWSIAFPGQVTTEGASSTPGLLNWKTINRSKNGNSQEVSTTITETIVDPWAKIFGSTASNKADTTTADFGFGEQTDTATVSAGLLTLTPQIRNWKTIGGRGSQPPTDSFPTTTEATWEIATDSGFGAKVQTTTENAFGANFETTTEELRGFGAGFETTTEPFPGFGSKFEGGGFETTNAPGAIVTDPFPPFPGLETRNTPIIPDTQQPFSGFGGVFETTNAPEKIATDPFPALPNNFGPAATVPPAPAPVPQPAGPNIPSGTNEERWQNKGPPPVPGLTRQLCEDNAAVAAKYGIKDIIVWVDSNCVLARTVFKGRSCEDFSNSARWCYA